MEALREQRESTICSTRDELYSAQEEVLPQLQPPSLSPDSPWLTRTWCFCFQILVLRHAMETATAEREREIAALQADLGSVRSELEHWRTTAAKYEEEIGRLQEAFSQQQQQQNSACQLQGERCLCLTQLWWKSVKCFQTSDVSPAVCLSVRGLR